MMLNLEPEVRTKAEMAEGQMSLTATPTQAGHPAKQDFFLVAQKKSLKKINGGQF